MRPWSSSSASVVATIARIVGTASESGIPLDGATLKVVRRTIRTTLSGGGGMHARKTMIKGSPEQTEQARQVIESHVIPKAKELRGFRGGYWLIDREAGETMSFTFFDTKKDLEASEDAAAQLRSSGVAQIQGASVAGVHNYEVGLSTGEKVHDRASHARVLT